MSIRTRVAALESRIASNTPVVAWLDYRCNADDVVVAVCVNGTTTVERLPGESIDAFDERALRLADVVADHVITFAWVKPGRTVEAADCSR